jgi:DNA-binding PadR family transcriptional regulator
MSCHGTSRTDVDRKMGARDFIDLAALGAAARVSADFGDIRSAIGDIVGHLWTPVSEVIAGCLEDLVRTGCLQAADNRFDQLVFTITETGWQRLRLLLAQPTDCPICPLGQVGLKLKLAFIDLAPVSERRHYLEKIVCIYERELGGWVRRCGSCPRQGALGRMWLDVETDRLQREIAMLRNMASGQTTTRLQ